MSFDNREGTRVPNAPLQFIEDGEGLLWCRLIIGIGLASFVTCQVWCSQMFNKEVVGIANATAGGWGNLGGGVTQIFIMWALVIPMREYLGFDDDLAWRSAMIVPSSVLTNSNRPQSTE